MIKSIIFDWGGVLAPADHILASKSLSAKYGYDAESLKYEFKTNEAEFATGKRDSGFFRIIAEKFDIPSEDVKKALNEIPHNEVFEFAKSLKSKGFKIFLLSDQMKFRSDYIKEHNDLSFFDNVFFSNEIGFIKTSILSFHHFLKTTQQKPEECIFIDDRIENINMAKRAGINTIHFISLEQLKKELVLLSIV